jgi:hypothetical protein
VLSLLLLLLLLSFASFADLCVLGVEKRPNGGLRVMDDRQTAT